MRSFKMMAVLLEILPLQLDSGAECFWVLHSSSLCFFTPASPADAALFWQQMMGHHCFTALNTLLVAALCCMGAAWVTMGHTWWWWAVSSWCPVGHPLLGPWRHLPTFSAWLSRLASSSLLAGLKALSASGFLVYLCCLSPCFPLQ